MLKDSEGDRESCREVERRRENNARDRYLLAHEEDAVRAALSEIAPERVPELDIALHTGMKRGERYGCEWLRVDLENKVVTVPRSKHGEKRRVYLNDAAAAAFRELWRFSAGEGRVFAYLYRSDRTVGATGWFEQASAVASVKTFRWHDSAAHLASRLVVAGVDIRTVQEVVGHNQI